jgi:UDP:flavonoid glycosyltransferase YjiC (YdhE family)
MICVKCDTVRFDLSLNTMLSEHARPVVLFFPFGYMSHYLRCIMLARALKDEYDVLFLDNLRYRPFLKKEGFRTFSCLSWKENEVMDHLKRFDFSWLNTDNLENIFKAQKAAIQKYRPIAVIGDNDPALKMAADATDVHYVSVLNGYMSKYFSGIRELSRRHPTYLWMRWLPRKLRGLLTKFGEILSMKAIHKPFRILREKYGLPGKNSYLDELEGNFNIICDPPELFPQSELPQNYCHTAALMYDEDANDDPVRRLLDPHKRTLFVNMGSTGDWERLHFLNDPFYQRYNIITAGDEKGVLEPVCTANFSFLPAAAILPLSDLVICHGGNGTIQLCLKYGVPVLCSTTYFEQEWNVSALERVMHGRSIDDEKDPERLKMIVQDWIKLK